MSKFIEVKSGDKSWVLNVKQIQCVGETCEGNAKVYFGEEDVLILNEGYIDFVDRLDQVAEVEKI